MELANKTIREIALEAPMTARVFEQFKIDYCCGGRVNFLEACETAGVQPKVVQERLEAVLRSAQPASDSIEKSSPTALIEHIVYTHHVFTRSELNRLLPLMEKVVRRHGEAHPELLEIQEKFITLNDELLPHMAKEEMVLFPYIKELEQSNTTGGSVRAPHFGTVRNPVRMMMFEHDAAGDILRGMRRLSADYTVPEGACPSFAALYAGLENLEKDLHQHIHLENNVLFEQAVEMERNDSAVADIQTECSENSAAGCSGLNNQN